MSHLEKKYHELYSRDPWFQDQYQHRRGPFYDHPLYILRQLGVRRVVDIGCSYGLFVDQLNQNDIEAFGVDLPIDALKEFHARLTHSKHRFIYGSAQSDGVLTSIESISPEAVTLIETLRYVEQPENLGRISAPYVVIREVSDNWETRRRRMYEFDFQLYSPRRCLKLFPNHEVHQIYFCKSRLRLSAPKEHTLRVINLLFPSYLLVLARKKPETRC